MGLTNKQKKYIREHHQGKSAGQLARELKIDQHMVREYLDAIAPPAGNRKKSIFYVAALLIPVLFFLILEASLRFFDYRGDTSLFVFPEEYFEGEYGFANRNFNARYFFNTRNLPGFSNDAFLAEKPDTAFRVFAMGGSSTAGYPYGFNATFSRVTADALKDVLPGRKVEVVNLGTSAVNSYTLYDQIPEILEQKPDAILIYAGHNEFYGALGVGSSEQFGAFPGFVRTYLKLQRLKTFMLLRDGIVSMSQWVASTLMGQPHPAHDGTLMQRMVQDQTITLDSRVFEYGMNQFESNLDKILERFRRHGIPVFIASLASNLRDQEPFVSIETPQHPPAKQVFEQARIYYRQSDFERAYDLFVLAKDLDALKFRAPELFNEIIREKAEKHGATYVPVYEDMRNHSSNRIIGFDLMLEHLHPNRTGYFLIGKSFYEAISGSGLLDTVADYRALRSWDEYYDMMRLTELDERIAYHRVRLLTSGWPFVTGPPPDGYPGTYQPSGRIDQLAFDVVHTNKRWDQAKLDVADYYAGHGEFELALNEYEGLIRDQPYNYSPFVFAGRLLLQVMNDFERARPHFENAWRINPSNYAARMLGSIEVNDGNYDRGIHLLEKALEFNPDDIQALFNLSGAQALSGDLETAYVTAQRLDRIQPDFPGLPQWKQQLESRLQRTRKN
jgi:tetratricopeptide (TPR) repeat protein